VLKDGSVRYEARLQVDGRDRRVPLEAQTAFDAVREYEHLRTDRDRGDIRQNDLINPTVRELADEWLAHMQARVGIADDKRRYAQGTVDVYRSAMRLHVIPFLGSRRIRDVTASDLRRLIGHLEASGLAPMTISGDMHRTSALLDFAVKNGYADHNVYRDVGREDRPGEKRLTDPRYLAGDEIRRLLGGSPDRWRPLYATLAYAGLRLSEGLGLVWSEVDFDENVISVSQQLSRSGATRVPLKTASSAADVPMVPALKRELQAHRSRQAEQNLALVRPEHFVFTTKFERPPATTANIRALLQRVATEVGLNPPGLPPVSCHDLRHSCITLALESGATVAEAAELARHANPQTTIRMYAGLTKDGRGAAARKMLDAGFGA
jgi:integrase